MENKNKNNSNRNKLFLTKRLNKKMFMISSFIVCIFTLTIITGLSIISSHADAIEWNTDDDENGTSDWIEVFNLSNSTIDETNKKVTTLSYDVSPLRASEEIHMFSKAKINNEDYDIELTTMESLFGIQKDSSNTTIKNAATNITAFYGHDLDTSKCTSMKSLFNGCSNLVTADMGSNFDCSNSENLQSLFCSCKALEEVKLGPGFKTSDKLLYAKSLFYKDEKIEKVDISKFNFSNVEIMEDIFNGCKVLNEITFPENFDCSNATSMKGMFKDCNALTVINMEGLITSNKLTNVTEIFENCSSLADLNLGKMDLSNFDFRTLGWFNSKASLVNVDLSGVTISPVTTTDLNSAFYGMENLKSIEFGPNFDTSGATNMRAMFKQCYKLETIDLSHFDCSSTTNMEEMFSYDHELKTVIFNFKKPATNNLTVNQMFYEDRKLETVDFTGFGNDACTNYSAMFEYCESLKEVDLRPINTQNGQNFGYMFYDCKSVKNIDLSNFNAQNAKNFGSMFYNCYMLEELDLSSFETPNLDTMNSMFYGCMSLKELDISTFDVSNVTSCSSLFASCENLEKIDMGTINFSNTNNFESFFLMCTKLKEVDLSHFTFGDNIFLRAMFDGCMSLKKLDLSTIDASKIYSSDSQYFKNIIRGCISLEEIKTPINVPGNFTDIEFTKDVTVTVYSTSPLGWITDSVNSVMFDEENVSKTELPKLSPVSLTYHNYMLYEDSNGKKYYERDAEYPFTNLSVSGHNVTLYKFDDGVVIIRGSGETNNCSDPDTYPVITDKTALTKLVVVTDNESSKIKVNAKNFFTGCDNLEEIVNIEGLEFIGPEYESMFEGCKKLKEINASNFDMTGATNLDKMFLGCDALEKLDMSFDASGITSMSEILKLTSPNLVSIKVPTNVKKGLLNIELPITMYDANGNSYISIPVEKYPSFTLTKNKPVIPNPPGGGGGSQKEEKAVTITIGGLSDFNPYMTGYKLSDGKRSFKPNKFITRDEVAAIFTRLNGSYNEKENYTNYLKQYIDENECSDLWSRNYIGFVTSKKIMNGFDDGLFYPLQNMTRAQFCVAICNFKNINLYQVLNRDTNLIDIKGKWYESYAKAMFLEGYIKGYEDNSFKGDDPITRAEACTIINRVMKVDIEKESNKENIYNDVFESDWYYKDVLSSTMD